MKAIKIFLGFIYIAGLYILFLVLRHHYPSQINIANSLTTFSFINTNFGPRSNVDNIIVASNVSLLALYNTSEQLPHPKERMRTMRPFDFQLSTQEKRSMYRILALFDRVMLESGIPYFMHSGTLLGSYRFHDLLPWDDDVDLFVSLSSREDMRKAIAWAVERYAPDLVLFQTLGHDKIFFRNSSWTNANTYGWNWPYLDISFYHINKTHVWDSVQTYGQVDTYPRSVIFPLASRPFFSLNLPAPHDTFAYCAWSYGYTNECVVSFYSHMLEGGGIGTKNNPDGAKGPDLRRRENCIDLATRRRLPRVIRRRHKEGGSIEELVDAAGSVVQRLLISAPDYACETEDFVIHLRNGSSDAVWSQFSQLQKQGYLPKNGHKGVF